MKLTNLKTLTILSALAIAPLAIPSASTFAQDSAESEEGQCEGRHARRGDGEGRRGGPMRMFRGLDLSETQEASIRAIFEENRGAMEILREEGDREAMRALRQSIKAEVEVLLTEEQIATLEARREARGDREGRRGRRGPRGGSSE